MSEIEVKTCASIEMATQDFVFVSKRGNKRAVYNFYTGQSKELDTSEMCPKDFIMRIPSHLWDEIALQLAELLDKKGIKTENDHKIQGIMKAQKYHLEDMRKLVFKKK